MSLYLEHFGLAEPPFRITPHTDFFFAGANRGPMLEALCYAIIQEEGIVKLTGEVGSGKTMLCRMLLEKLPAHVESVYLANPSLSRQEILGAIADELGIPAKDHSAHALTRSLQEALIERHAAHRRVVLLIDEAHAMPAESLEEIRLLSNLETRRNKLLQIALFAQPELDERLAANDMRQLRERITQHFTLAPLAPEDVASYLEFRLRAAGYRGPNPFTAKALARIVRASEGLSRRINILADKALLAAYSEGSHQVGEQEVQTAIEDARFLPLLTPAHPKWPWAVAAGASALFAGGVWLAASQTFSAPEAANSAAWVGSAPSGAGPAPASSETPGVRNPPAENSASRTQEAQARYEAWFPGADKRHYFLHLMAVEAAEIDKVESFLERFSDTLDLPRLRVYRSDRSGRDRLGVIYGEFPTRAAAQNAARALPQNLRRLQPYPRPVAKL